MIDHGGDATFCEVRFSPVTGFHSTSDGAGGVTTGGTTVAVDGIGKVGSRVEVSGTGGFSVMFTHCAGWPRAR